MTSVLVTLPESATEADADRIGGRLGRFADATGLEILTTFGEVLHVDCVDIRWRDSIRNVVEAELARG